MPKFQYFDGVKFTKDEKTGYYLNSTLRVRMHRYVWEHYYGEIPEGFHVHHKDKNKANNEITNLELVPFSEHARMHSKEKAAERHQEIVENLQEKALPEAVRWHKSSEGKKWHKEHYENMKHRLHTSEKMVCEMCGVEYIGKVSADNRFCSNKCRAAWRRQSGIDDETRVCPCCGKEYTVNKYARNRTCSRTCANKMRALK